jgi:mRNA interferase YafQ
MRRISQRKQFRSDLKRQKRRGRDIDELIAAVELLAEQGAIPPAYHPHKLSGEWSGVWECHIEPDWLLIYTVTDEEVLF